MKNNFVTFALVIVYFIVILLIGYLAGKKTKNMSDFMIGGHRLGVWITSFGIMAAVMSGWTWIGNPGASYTAGYSSIVRLFSMGPIGLVLSYIFLAKPVRIISERKQCFTLPDILSARWNGNRLVRVLSMVIVLIGCFTYLVSQWSAMGTVLEPLLGISYRTAVIVGAVIICAYVVAGGMLASMWTNFIQMVIMFVVAIVLLIKAVGNVGGFTAMNLAAAAVDPNYVQPFWAQMSHSAAAVLSYGILIVGLSYGGQPSVNTKFMMISDTGKFRWSPLISCVALIVGTTTSFVGIVGVVMVNQGMIVPPERADTILMSVIAEMFSPGLAALVMIAVMAAVMSTAETYLFSSASTITHDFAVKYLNIRLGDKRCLLITRIMMAVVTICTVIMALNPTNMVAVIGAQAFGCFCAGFGPVLYLGIRWKRINSTGAVAGMITGLIFGGILPIIGPGIFDGTFLDGWNQAGIGVVISTLVTVVVSFATKPEYSDVFEFSQESDSEK